VTASAVLVPAPAVAARSADTAKPSDTRSVSQLLTDLQRLYRQAEKATETYNGTVEKLKQQQREVARLDARLARARLALRSSRREAGLLARQQYQSSADISPYLRLLLARDPQRALDQSHVLEELSREQTETVDQLTDATKHAEILARKARTALDERMTLTQRQKRQQDDVQRRLKDVEALLASKALVVDACRYVAREGPTVIELARRPVLFVLARALAEAWPADVPRDALIARAFRTKHADETHRARLRVEIGRLRPLLRDVADIGATPQGFALTPRSAREVVVLARPVEEKHAAVLAFLADGESWSSSALALALGASQRTVQRALDTLAAGQKVQSFGYGRARRWTMPPAPGFATTMLLPAPLPGD